MKKYKLGEIADIIVGYPFESAKFNTDGNGVLLVRGMNVSERFLRFGDEARYWNYITDDLKPYYLKENDIVIGMDGSKVGKNFALVKKEDLPLVLVQRVACIRAKKDYDQRYIWQYVSSKRFIEYVNTIKTGSSIPHISGNQISNFPIFVPDLQSQQKIATVFSSLDDKIALNRLMNAKLEQMAKRLYDHWFVQFDFPNVDGKPYKASGGKMEYNEVLKREIPDGWEVKSVNDISTSYRGVGYTADDEKSAEDNDVVLILRGNNISNNHIIFDGNTVYLDKSFVSEEQKIHKYDFVMTMSSGSKEHVGKSAMFLFDSPHSYGAFCNKITPAKDCQFFLENYLHSEYFKKYIQITCSGTGINNLTNEHFDKAFFPFPDNEVLESFNQKINPIYEQIGVLEKENLRLMGLRDKLLPLLMNGQVIVN